MLAASSSSYELMEFLVNRGANVNFHKGILFRGNGISLKQCYLAFFYLHSIGNFFFLKLDSDEVNCSLLTILMLTVASVKLHKNSIFFKIRTK